jgi:hypothetical protein
MEDLNNGIDVFLPTNMNRRMAIPLYADLSEVKLSVVQKGFICAQMDHDFDEYEDIIGLERGNQFISRYKLNQSTVSGWQKQYRTGGLCTIHDTVGKPKLPDEKGIHDALEEISEGVTENGRGQKNKKRLMNNEEIEACFNKHARFSKVRAGVNINPFNPLSCPPIHKNKMKLLKNVIMLHQIN